VYGFFLDGSQITTLAVFENVPFSSLSICFGAVKGFAADLRSFEITASPITASTNDYEFDDISWTLVGDFCLPIDIEIKKDDIALEGNETFNISAIGMWFACFKTTTVEPNLLGDTI
jgi:hypothetical protein